MMAHELNNPFLETFGTRLVEWRDGYAEMLLPLSVKLTNRSGLVQGGAICSLLDAVGGYAGLYTHPGAPRIHALTLSITTNFLTNGSGDALTAKGYVEKKGTTVYFARGEVWLDDEVLLATAIGTYRYLNSKAVRPN